MLTLGCLCSAIDKFVHLISSTYLYFADDCLSLEHSKMSKQCRLCAKFTESVIDLFLEHESTLLTKINSFLPTTISNAKGLPSKICCRCVDRTNETHSFIQEVMLAQAVFGIIPGDSPTQNTPPANSVKYGGVTISSMKKAAINVPTGNKKTRDKSRNVSETLRKLKKMQTGMTISKKIVPGIKTEVESDEVADVKPTRRCKAEPKLYKEEDDDDDDFGKDDDQYDDPNYDELKSDGSNNDDDDVDLDNDDDDTDYKPTSNAKVKPIRKTTQSRPNDAADNDSKFKSIQINAPPVFLCMKCKNKFDSLADLKQHVFQKNSCTTLQLTCEVCGKTFDSRKRLMQHSKVHEEKAKFICDKCGKMYTNQFNLENHKSSQHGEYIVEECKSMYKCRLCDERYTNRTDLYSHMKTHSQDKQQLLCDLCGKCFNNAHNLKSHLKSVHLDIRPFPCTFCEKRFRTRLILKQHMHVHTGIKEFECSHCPQTFAKADSLRLHTRKKHPEVKPGKPYSSSNPVATTDSNETAVTSAIDETSTKMEVDNTKMEIDTT